MTYFESSQAGSDKSASSAPPEHNGAKVDMTDRNISELFRSNSQDSSALVGDQLHISNPYSQEDVERMTPGNQQGFDRDTATPGDSPQQSGSQNYVMRCDTTSGSTTDASGTATDATTASGSGQDAFIQQLSQSDPNLATMLTDAQQQMSSTGASQLEANVMANFNQNNGQFPTDSSLMNASIGQMDGQGIASNDIINAQNSVDTDVSNPNIGDAPVSTFSSSGSDSGGSSSASGSSEGSGSDSSASSSSCDGSSSCDNSGSSGSGSDSSNPEQQDLSQLEQDLQSGNFQQFLQDLINDLPTLLGSSDAGSGSDAGSSDGGSTPGSSSEAPPPSSDGTTPNPTTGSDAPPTTTTPGATASSLANVPNATAQITDTLSNGQEESLGSGYFVQGQNGTPYLVTDDHVTVDPGTVTATLANGETVPVNLAGTNPSDDLAAYTSPGFNGVSTLALDPNLVSSGSAEAYVPLQEAGAGFYSGNLSGTSARGDVAVTPDDSYEQGILNAENPNDTMIGFDAPLQAGSSGSPILVDTSQGWEVASMQDDGNGTSNFTTSSQDVQSFVNSLSA